VLEGQQTSLIQHVDLESIDPHLEFRCELLLKVAQTGLGGEIILKSGTAPQGLAVHWMAQDAQHLVTGEVSLSLVEAQQVHAHRMKGHLPLGRGHVDVGSQQGFQGDVVEESNGDFKISKGKSVSSVDSLGQSLG
jgi:hypothetical protein